MMQFAETYQLLHTSVERVLRGKSEVIRLALSCLLAEGHLLIEDVPGTGKTSLAKAIASGSSGAWRRIQFTPDLLPSDITGVMVFEPDTARFSFREGPVFANVVIGDEINRASPKTQSALLEVMEERQVTTDGVSRRVPRPFFVIATQNPHDFHGTYPLPDVQLDRFAMCLSIGYADPSTEMELLRSEVDRRVSPEPPPAISLVDVEVMMSTVDSVHVAPAVAGYIVAIAAAARRHPDVRLGVSTRGIISLQRVARAFAATDGRSYVTPEDVKVLAEPVLAHRISLTAEAAMRGTTAAQVVADVLGSVDVPRQRSADER
jgi:MoxR-like ATPase